MIKVTHTEKLGNISVIKGRLICGNVGSFGNMMDTDELRGKLRPIIISELEELEAGATVAFNCEDAVRIGKIVSRKGTGKFWVCDFDLYNETISGERLFKILALPENFSNEQLKMIVDGKLKNEEAVLLECSEIPVDVYDGIRDELKDTRNGTCDVINLFNNYITLHKITN